MISWGFDSLSGHHKFRGSRFKVLIFKHFDV